MLMPALLEMLDAESRAGVIEMLGGAGAELDDAALVMLLARAYLDQGVALRDLLGNVGQKPRDCRYCGVPLVMVFHPASGRWAPYEISAGVNHFMTCPHAAQAKSDALVAKVGGNRDPRPAPPVGPFIQPSPVPEASAEESPRPGLPQVELQPSLFPMPRDHRRHLQQ